MGDPAAVDWVITLGYLVTAVLCFLQARRSSRDIRERPIAGQNVLRSAKLWYFFSAITFALGLNKQLDLQTLFVELARSALLFEGWYELRRTLQRVFFAILAAATAGTGLVMMWRYFAFVRQQRLIVAALALVLLYAVLRAAEFNHIVDSNFADADEHGFLGPLEFAGVALMLCGTFHRAHGYAQLRRSECSASDPQ